ncbi:MAG: PqqD family protein [Thermodesulfobacteriota bacterium]
MSEDGRNHGREDAPPSYLDAQGNLALRTALRSDRFAVTLGKCYTLNRGQSPGPGKPIVHSAEDSNKRLIKEDSMVSREIMGEIILVPIRRIAGEIDGIYSLNEVAARIWNLIDGERSVEEISKVIVEEYEVSPEEAFRDTVELCRQLVALGAAREA